MIANKHFLGVIPKVNSQVNIKTRCIDSSILWAQMLVTVLQEAKVNRLNDKYTSGTLVISTTFSPCSLLRGEFVKAKELYFEKVS